jgi:hypothetical protein
MVTATRGSTAGPGLTHLQQRQVEQALDACRTDKAKFADLFFGVELFPWQKAAMARTARVDTWVAGRRTGKTLANTIDRVHDLAFHPNRVGYIGGPSVDQAGQYFREIEAAMARPTLMESLLKDGGVRWAPFPSVTLVNGSVMHGRSTVRDGIYLRGKGAHWVALTEAAWINDAVYEQVVRALVLDKHGDIRLETTPNGENYVYELDERATNRANRWVRSSDNAYYRAVHATVLDNPSLDTLDIDAIRQEVPEWVFRTEYLAEYLSTDETVFSWPLLVRLFDDDYPMQSGRLPGHRYVMGVDLAQVHDYTSIHVIDLTPVPNRQTMYRLAYWSRYRGKPYTGEGGVIEDVLATRKAFGNCPVYIDATSERSVAEQIPGAHAIQFTSAIRSAMFSHLLVLCERAMLSLPAMWVTLRDEMRALKRVKRGNGTRIDHPREGYDDCCFSLGLACMGVPAPATRPSGGVMEMLRNAQFYPA